MLTPGGWVSASIVGAPAVPTVPGLVPAVGKKNGVVLDIAENMNFLPLVGLRAQLSEVPRSATYNSEAGKDNGRSLLNTKLRRP